MNLRTEADRRGTSRCKDTVRLCNCLGSAPAQALPCPRPRRPRRWRRSPAPQALTAAPGASRGRTAPHARRRTPVTRQRSSLVLHASHNSSLAALSAAPQQTAWPLSSKLLKPIGLPATSGLQGGAAQIRCPHARSHATAYVHKQPQRKSRIPYPNLPYPILP